MGHAGLRLHRADAAIGRQQGVGGRMPRLLPSQRLHEKVHEAIADQFISVATGPRCGGAVHVKNAPAVLVDYHDRVSCTVEQQAIAFLAAANPGQDAARHAQPQQRGNDESTQHAPEQDLAKQHRTLDHLHREQIRARCHVNVQLIDACALPRRPGAGRTTQLVKFT